MSDRGAGMLRWALIFLVVSLVAGALGFTGIASGARTIAKILFVMFLLGFILLILLAWGAGELIF